MKPVGTPFDGLGTHVVPMQDAGAPQPGLGSRRVLASNVSGLESGTPYRVRYRTVSGSRLVPQSPWRTMPGNPRAEATFRTDPGAVLDVAGGPVAGRVQLALAGATSSGGPRRLTCGRRATGRAGQFAAITRDPALVRRMQGCMLRPLAQLPDSPEPSAERTAP